MGVNISGKGVLSGLATLVAGVVQSFNLLVTRIIGYTNVPGTGSSSYYTTTVGFNGPGFMAFPANSDVAAYSQDGSTWNTSTMPSVRDWVSPTYGNGKFVVLGYNSNVVAYSEDGVTWNTSTMPSVPSFQLWQLTYGDGKFVAVVSYQSNVSAYSTDGITWTQTTLPVTGDWMQPIYGDGKFVSTSYATNKVIYSTNGINWTQATLPVTRDWMSGTYGDGKFVLIADSSNISVYSTNGINWTQSTLPATLRWQDITYGDGKFVAISSFESNIGVYSTNGINWTQFTMPSAQSWYNIVYDNGRFVANSQYATPAGNGIVAYSTDGITWTQTTLPTERPWLGLTAGILSAFVEIQISIGNQGEEGAEILAPVDVYTVPVSKTTDIDEVTVKNNSANTITYDLAVLNAGIELTDQNALINDQAILAGATATITNISSTLVAGQRIVVFPSAVDVVEVKVYGTESNI